MKRITMYVVALVIATPSTAQTASPKPALVPVSKTAPGKPSPLPEAPNPPFTPVFFTPDGSPSAYAVNDPEKVFDWVEGQMKAVTGKIDKFSTPEEREQHIQALRIKLEGIGRLPFMNKCGTKYDPNTQQYTIQQGAKWVDWPDSKGMNLRQIVLDMKNLSSGTYSAQNAFGARAEVTQITSVVHSLYILAKAGERAGPASDSGSASYDSYASSAKMSPHEARMADADIACLWVVKLEAPYMSEFAATGRRR